MGQTRVAVVDIGTNSTRLLIAAIDGEHVTEELERRSNVTRLGAGRMLPKSAKPSAIRATVTLSRPCESPMK